ncbi:MAG: HD domain-containing protein, partial [Bacteroidota bacterium]
FYVASMLVVISGFHQVQLMGFMLNFVVAMLSLHWVLALIMALGGSILALYTFQWTMGVAALPAEWSLVSFTILYFYFILLLFVSVFMATRHRNAATQLAVRNTRLTAKQQTLWQQLMQALYRREHFVQEMTTEGAQALRMVNKLSHTLARQVEQASNMPPSLTKAQKTLQQASQKLTVVGNYLHEMIARLQDYLPLEVSTFHIETLLEAMEQGLAEQGISPPPQVIYQVHTQHKELQGDVNKLKELLVRSICYIYEHHHANYILLSIQDTTLGYRLRTIPEYVKRVEALCWTITLENDVPPCKAFYMGNKEQPVTSIVQGSSLLSLKPNQQIVDAHYGASELLTGEQGLTQVYVIPVHVRAVRPQAMESLSTAPPLPEAYVYPAEQAFIEAVTNKTKGAEALLEKALGLLKQYHDGVYCRSGVPFYLYPIAVAHLLLTYSQDEDTVLVALLHETVETTRLSLNQIGILFNPTVQQLVAGITRLDSNLKSFKRLQLSEDEALMQLIEVKDERILYVKLAARLHAMRALGEHSSSSHRKQLASETLQFYVLLAERLGLQEVAQEFKELCLQVFRQKD